MGRSVDMEALRRIERQVDRCRSQAACEYPPCGPHAVGKPVHQVRARSPVVVVGEAPGPHGWWSTGRPFWERDASGELVLSRAGRNLTRILQEIGASIDRVTYLEAVKCRPREACAWTPDEDARRRCRRFLKEEFLILKPRLLLALGSVATASCFEIAGLPLPRPFRLGDLVGRSATWRAPWRRRCLLVPLYHPSSANGGRWPRDVSYLHAVRVRLLGLSHLH